MKKTNLYIILIFVGVALIALVITGSGRKKKLDERLSFRKNDKIPYGTWVAYHGLSGMFPSASVVTNRREPGLWEEISADSTNQFFLAITPRFMPEDYEMRQLIRFVENGNDVMISTREISDAAATLLECAVNDNDIPYYFESNNLVTQKDDSLSVSLGQPYFSQAKRFAYPGRKYDATFTRVNQLTVYKLGYNGEGELNFVQFQAGKGHFFLHLAPLAFSNYFLLHRQNLEYYEQVMSLIRPDIKKVVWDEYFMYKRNQEQERDKKSWLKVLSRYPGLKAALITAFLTLLIYLLLEMRRKQRIIPVVAKPKNDSLDFVKTIGRLYYDRSDHKNLCRKMGTYFLEYVRNRYKLPTGTLDETFIQQLQFKTGAAEKEIRGIVSFIKYVEDSPAVTAADVSAFHQQLESFYKNA